MRIIEVTGEPCAGKTTFIQSLSCDPQFVLFSRQWLINDLGLVCDSKLMARFIYESYMLLAGLKGAGYSRLSGFFIAVVRLNEPLFRKINIYRNIIHKYAVHYRAMTSENKHYLVLDEGISHIPYLFTGGLDVIDHSLLFSFPYEKPWVIKLSLDIETVISRLLCRGHKRIDREEDSAFKFAAENKKCSKVQDVLLSGYKRNASFDSLNEQGVNGLVYEVSKWMDSYDETE